METTAIIAILRSLLSLGEKMYDDFKKLPAEKKSDWVKKINKAFDPDKLKNYDTRDIEKLLR